MSKKVDVPVIADTNLDLKVRTREGTFLSDLPSILSVMSPARSRWERACLINRLPPDGLTLEDLEIGVILQDTNASVYREKAGTPPECSGPCPRVVLAPAAGGSPAL